MNEKMVSKLCLEYFAEEPQTVERCAVGQGNYVYIVECNGTKYVVRCSPERHFRGAGAGTEGTGRQGE